MESAVGDLLINSAQTASPSNLKGVCKRIVDVAR